MICPGCAQAAAAGKHGEEHHLPVCYDTLHSTDYRSCDCLHRQPVG